MLLLLLSRRGCGIGRWWSTRRRRLWLWRTRTGRGRCRIERLRLVSSTSSIVHGRSTEHHPGGNIHTHSNASGRVFLRWRDDWSCSTSIRATGGRSNDCTRWRWDRLRRLTLPRRLRWRRRPPSLLRLLLLLGIGMLIMWVLLLVRERRTRWTRRTVHTYSHPKTTHIHIHTPTGTHIHIHTHYTGILFRSASFILPGHITIIALPIIILLEIGSGRSRGLGEGRTRGGWEGVGGVLLMGSGEGKRKGMFERLNWALADANVFADADLDTLVGEGTRQRRRFYVGS